jgi:hypothetical protein
MTVDQHHVTDPPVPGGPRQELVQGTLTLSGGTAQETITTKLEYSSKPVITLGAGAGSTDESVTASLVDDDPTSDGDITIRVDGSTDEDKEYHVTVTDEIAGD